MAIAERLAQALEGLRYVEAECRDGMDTLDVERGALRGVFERLKTAGGFESSTLVTAVDRYPAEPRYQVIWQFLSVTHGARVRVRCLVGADEASVPTVTDLWPGAAFSERECFDMFGVDFEGNRDLRRLLMPQGYDHHPLRKDFPHQGIEPDRLYRQWDRARRVAGADEASGEGSAR